MTPTTILYRIDLAPIGKGRPRFTRATGRARTPESTRQWEAQAAAQLREQHTGQALDARAPMWCVSIDAYYPRPKARPAYVPLELWKIRHHDLHARSRYDLDNVAKIVLDALQQGCVLEDDRCVVVLHAEAWFAGDEGARVEVYMTEVQS